MQLIGKAATSVSATATAIAAVRDDAAHGLRSSEACGEGQLLHMHGAAPARDDAGPLHPERFRPVLHVSLPALATNESKIRSRSSGAPGRAVWTAAEVAFAGHNLEVSSACVSGPCMLIDSPGPPGSASPSTAPPCPDVVKRFTAPSTKCALLIASCPWSPPSGHGVTLAFDASTCCAAARRSAASSRGQGISNRGRA